MIDSYWIYVERVVEGVKVHQVYQGESLETETNTAAVGFGHHQASMSTVNGIKFGRAFDDGHDIDGIVNLKSHLDRILLRARKGDLGRLEEIRIVRRKKGVD